MLWDSRNRSDRGEYYLGYDRDFVGDKSVRDYHVKYHKIAKTATLGGEGRNPGDEEEDNSWGRLAGGSKSLAGQFLNGSQQIVDKIRKVPKKQGANQQTSTRPKSISDMRTHSKEALTSETQVEHLPTAIPHPAATHVAQQAQQAAVPALHTPPAAAAAAAPQAAAAAHPPPAAAAHSPAAALAPPLAPPERPLRPEGIAAMDRAAHITTAPDRREPNKSSEGRDRKHRSATRSSSTSYESHTSRNSSGSKSESHYSDSSDEDGSDEQENEYKQRNQRSWVRGRQRPEPAHPKRTKVEYYPPAQDPPREYERPPQNMQPRDLFPGALINADTDRSITQDQEIINLAIGTPQERLEKVVKVIKNTILSIPFDVQNDLFQWTQYLPFCDCCYERPDPQHENGCMKQYGGCCTSLLLLILFYCFGLSLFLVQAQGISNCESGLVNPNAHLNVSCRGLAYECQVMPGVFSFRDYITFRILAYISLLTPFLYMPFTVILYVNMQASKISDMLEAILEPDIGALQQDAQRKAERDGKLKDLTFRDPSVSRLSIMREYIYDELKIMNKEGHNAWVFRLFVVFHVLFGMLSITLDGYFAKMTQNGMDTACSNLQNGILSTTDPNLTHFGFLGIYQLIFGCFYFIVTLLYLIIQQFDVCLTVVKQRRRMDAENAQENIGGKQRQKLLESTVKQKFRKIETEVSGIVHGNGNSYNGSDQWSGDQPPEWGQGGGWGQGGNPGWDQGGNQGWDQGWGRR